MSLKIVRAVAASNSCRLSEALTYTSVPTLLVVSSIRVKILVWPHIFLINVGGPSPVEVWFVSKQDVPYCRRSTFRHIPRNVPVFRNGITEKGTCDKWHSMIGVMASVAFPLQSPTVSWTSAKPLYVLEQYVTSSPMLRGVESDRKCNYVAGFKVLKISTQSSADE